MEVLPQQGKTLQLVQASVLVALLRGPCDPADLVVLGV